MKILIKIYNWIIKMAKKVLNLDTDTGAESWGSVDADNIVLDTTNFDKNLDTTITDVQKLADAVDELVLGGTQIQTDWNQSDNTQVDYIKNKPNGTAGQTLSYVGTTLTPTNKAKLSYNSTNVDYILQYDTVSNHPKIKLYNEEMYSYIILTSASGGFIESTINANTSLLRVKNSTASVEVSSISGTNYSRIASSYAQFSFLASSSDKTVIADSTGTLKLSSIPIHKYKEFLSERLTVVSDGYAFSNTQLGLDGVNLNDKIKMVQCYVIQADYPNVKNNELVMGHNIEDGQISVRLNFNLAVGDRIKIYLEYID